MGNYSGKSQDAKSVFVPAKHWQVGKSISGVVENAFPASGRDCYNVTLTKPITIDGDETNEVALGSSGIGMAVRAAKCGGLRAGDKFTLTCNELKDTGKESPMTMFDIEVEREGDGEF